MQSLFAVLGGERLKSLGFQVQGQSVADIGFVFDNQDLGHKRSSLTWE